jgi:hypothetical protein
MQIERGNRLLEPAVVARFNTYRLEVALGVELWVCPRGN